MSKEKYMALADFQTLWTNTIKPSLPSRQEVAETYATKTEVTNATLIPVDIDSLTPTTTFVKNNVIGINGVIYRAKKNTTEFPVVPMVEDGHIVYDEDENGNKAIVIEDFTMSEDWEIWTDASIPRTLEQMADQQLTFMTQQAAQQDAFIEQQTGALADFETEVRVSISGVIKSTDEITATSGQKYTVMQLLQAMAELMDKTVVVNAQQ
jgi:hypothetical protein